MADFTDIVFLDEVTGPLLDPLAPTIPAAGGGGEASPVVSNFAPAAGAVLERSGTISFDVTDDADLSCVQVAVYLVSTDATELAWNGDAFETKYSTSTRAAITDGYRYTIRRNGGWPGGGVRAKVRVIDANGNTEVSA